MKKKEMKNKFKLGKLEWTTIMIILLLFGGLHVLQWFYSAGIEEKVNIILTRMSIKPEKVGVPDYVQFNNISIKKGNRVEIAFDKSKEIWIGTVAKTGSMLPTISGDTDIIQVNVFSKEVISLGDLIVFERKRKDGEIDFILHRVIELGFDNTGWFCRTMGDNNLLPDEKIRFRQIRSKVVGLLY